MRLGLAGLPAQDMEIIRQEVLEYWPTFQTSRIVVTGATGFVGRWLVAALVHLRASVENPSTHISILVRNVPTARARLGEALWSEVDVVEADIRDPWFWDQPVDYVIHAATPASVRSGSRDPREVLVTSVLGTQRVIQALEAHGSVPRVLHLSSGAIYGEQPTSVQRMPEAGLTGPSPFALSSPYAEGKRASEALLESAGRDGILHPIQARLYAFMGPGLPVDDGFAIGNFVRSSALGETIQVRGDGTTVRSYLSARSLTIWLLRLLFRGHSGVPYNVGSPFGHPLLRWAGVCANLSGVRVSVGSAPTHEREIYVPDITNSESLGIVPTFESDEEALACWIDWLRSSQD